MKVTTQLMRSTFLPDVFKTDNAKQSGDDLVTLFHMVQLVNTLVNA